MRNQDASLNSNHFAASKEGLGYAIEDSPAPPQNLNLSPPRYRYSSIVEKGTIRLMLLQPSRLLDDPIQCSLITTTLEELYDDLVEHYVALSYVWGDAKNTRTISIDALRHIRDAGRVSRVWADGICIDQNDTFDRNQQVSLMGPIYSQARHTIIFIGESTPERDAFIRLLRSQALTSEGLRSPTDHRLTTGLTPTTSPSADHQILEASWFTRVWVLQELVLSSDPWLQCGSHRVRWSVFASAVLSAAPPSDPKAAARVAIVRHMDESRTKFQKKDNFTLSAPGDLLLDLLVGRRGLGVSDPRDMIYAHLELTDSATRAAIPVDYSKSVAEVYENIAKQCIQWKGVGSVLKYAENIELKNRREDLPSWVPDWTTPPSKHGRSYIQPKVLEIISTIFPSILGLVGWSSGIIMTLFPRSFFHDLPIDLRSLFDYLLQPNPTIHALFHALIINSPSKSLVFPSAPQKHIPKNLPPVLKSVFATYSHLPSHQILYEILHKHQYLRMQVSDGQSVAILHNNKLVITPSSSRIGDTVGRYYGQLPSNPAPLILRPWSPQLTTLQQCEDEDIESKLLQDINTTTGRPKIHHAAIARVQQCQFVAMEGHEWNSSDKIARKLDEEENEPTVFALR